MKAQTTNQLEQVTVYFDGACWPNPDGVAAAGVFITDGSDVLLQKGFFVGRGEAMSSNVAEYSALNFALLFLKEKGFVDREIVCQGDSKLVILQMSGKWKIKDGIYVGVATRAKLLAKEFTDLTFQWIPREKNTICDELAGNALAGLPPDRTSSVFQAVEGYMKSKA